MRHRERLLTLHPGNPRLLYEVGGAYDTAGEKASAVGYYTRALELGLEGTLRRQCLLQLASTLPIARDGHVARTHARHAGVFTPPP